MERSFITATHQSEDNLVKAQEQWDKLSPDQKDQCMKNVKDAIQSLSTIKKSIEQDVLTADDLSDLMWDVTNIEFSLHRGSDDSDPHYPYAKFSVMHKLYREFQERRHDVCALLEKGLTWMGKNMWDELSAEQKQERKTKVQQSIQSVRNMGWNELGRVDAIKAHPMTESDSD